MAGMIENAVFAFLGAFFRSKAAQKELDRWDRGAGKYAPPIRRDHAPWPGASHQPQLPKCILE